MVRRAIVNLPILQFNFIFLGHEQAYDQRDANFIQFFGLRRSTIAFILSDFPSFQNKLRVLYAIIDGKRVEKQDAIRPSAVSSHTWGHIKQQVFLNLAIQGRIP